MPKRHPKRTFFVIITALVVGVSVLLWRLGLPFPYAYLIGINFVTLLGYGYDKRQAIVGRGRVPEVVLHVTALLGGSPGGLAAQGLFRHKTRKLKFKLIFVAIVVFQLLVAGSCWLFMLRAQ